MTSDNSARATATRSVLSRWGLRLLVWGSVLALITAAVGGFFGARRLVADQERRALTERAATIEASLRSTEQSTIASLKVLAGIAGTPTPGALEVFNRVARQQLATSSAVGAARLVAGRYDVVAGVGSVRPGVPLSAERTETLARARSARSFVVTLLPSPQRLILALAVDDLVVFQESPLAPGGHVGTTFSFGNVEVALYAGSASDPARLVLATAELPLSGVQIRRPFKVGPDQWQLVVASEAPLAGTLTHRVPWIILGFGLLAALLIGLVLMTLLRRRAYALRMVTQRTAALEAAKRFQESLLTSGPMIVARSRKPDLAVTYLSPNAARILGVPDIEAEFGTNRRDAGAHPEDLPRLRAALESVSSGNVTTSSLEMRARTAPSTYRWVSTQIVAERDANTGEVTGVLSYVLDIDDRKRAEQALRAARQSAESANQAKSQFLSRMSHELRTPMNAVLGFGQLLELDDLTPMQRESVGFILNAGKHLLRLIDDVLDISRIDAGTMSLSPEPVLPHDVIIDALRLVQAMAESRQVRLHFDPPKDEPPVLADHHRLRQILLNLLTNAVKYNVDCGEVTVTVRALDGDRVRIEVADTGPGIPQEKQGLLFMPFQRLGAEHGPVQGTGIGLALSRQLAEAMGGSLGLASTSAGSTFWVELPRAELHAPQAIRPHVLHVERTVQMPRTQRPCILQIEDDPSNARLMERLLEDRHDIELIVATVGKVGLELARTRQPKLVLLDLHLPDLHGEDVLRELRAHGSTADIPVVVVSADGTHGQSRRLRDAGANAYLTKPFDIAELLALIDNALAAPDAVARKAQG